MTQSTSSEDNSLTPGGRYDQGLLMEDPFYNFEEMGESSLAVQSLLDPSNPNAIPFFDTCLIGDGAAMCRLGGSEFNPELFDSILSSGDAILARLESTSGSVTPGSVTSADLPPGPHSLESEGGVFLSGGDDSGGVAPLIAGGGGVAVPLETEGDVTVPPNTDRVAPAPEEGVSPDPRGGVAGEGVPVIVEEGVGGLGEGVATNVAFQLPPGSSGQGEGVSVQRNLSVSGPKQPLHDGT